MENAYSWAAQETQGAILNSLQVQERQSTHGVGSCGDKSPRPRTLPWWNPDARPLRLADAQLHVRRFASPASLRGKRGTAGLASPPTPGGLGPGPRLALHKWMDGTPSRLCVSAGSVATVALSPWVANLQQSCQTQLLGSFRSAQDANEIPTLDTGSPNTRQAPPFTYREPPGRRRSRAWLLQQPPRQRRRPRLRNRKPRELKSKPEKAEPREGKLSGAHRSTFCAVIGGSVRVTGIQTNRHCL